MTDNHVSPSDQGQRPGEALPADSGNPFSREAPTLPPSEPTGDSLAQSSPTASIPGYESSPTASIPGYEIVSELGRGGMGVVYQARQISAERLVALKMILAGAHASEAELARFRAEAQAVARLQHPNVVQIFEVGEHHGLPFFSLEFCPGGSLEKELAGKPLPPIEAAHLVDTLACAIQAAHDKGIIHRDLKPANVLLAEDGTLKVTDFGLAKRLDAAGLTATGAVMGTPSYMAPEQAGSKGKTIGPAADIYALGAILYECLTGRPPFRAATPLDTVLQVVSEEPVPPRLLNAKVPRDLETICLKCLQKEPTKRYASAEALAEDLRRFLDNKPITARPVGLLERGWRWCRRNRALATASSIAVLGVLLALITLTGALVAVSGSLNKAEELANANRLLAEDAQRQIYFNLIALAEREHAGGNLGRAWNALQKCPPEHRNWEWHFLRRLCRVTPHINVDPSIEIASYHAVAFSPDGNFLAALALNKTKGASIILWQVSALQTGPLKRLRTIALEVDQKGVSDPHSGIWAWGNSLAWSPDSKRLALGVDTRLRIWDIETGAVVRDTSNHSSPIAAAVFSPDGKALASASSKVPGNFRHKDKWEVRLWEVATGIELFSWTGDIKGALLMPATLAFGSGGKEISTFGGYLAPDQRLRTWDAVSGKEVRIRDFNREWGTWREEKGIPIPGQPQKVVKVGWIDQAISTALSPDARRLAVTLQKPFGGGKSLVVLDLANGENVGKIPIGHYNATPKVFSPDGKRLAVLISVHALRPQNTQILLWEPGSNRPSRPIAYDARHFTALTLSPDGKRLASASAPTFAVEGVLPDVKEPKFRLEAGPELAIWELASAGVILRGEKAFNDVARSPDGVSSDGCTRAVAGSDREGDFASRGELRIVDVKSGSAVLKLRTDDQIVSLAGGFLKLEQANFSPDAKHVATVGNDGKVRIWDLKREIEVLKFQAHTGIGRAIVYSADGKRLLTAGDDRYLIVWEAATGQEILRLRSHSDAVVSLAFSGDGKRLVSRGADGAVGLWDATEVDEPQFNVHELLFGW